MDFKEKLIYAEDGFKAKLSFLHNQTTVAVASKKRTQMFYVQYKLYKKLFYTIFQLKIVARKKISSFWRLDNFFLQQFLIEK